MRKFVCSFFSPMVPVIRFFIIYHVSLMNVYVCSLPWVHSDCTIGRHVQVAWVGFSHTSVHLMNQIIHYRLTLNPSIFSSHPICSTGIYLHFAEHDMVKEVFVIFFYGLWISSDRNRNVCIFEVSMYMQISFLLFLLIVESLWERLDLVCEWC